MFVFACASALVPVGVTAAIASWPMRPEAAVSAPSDPPASAPGGKKKVTNADELPRHTYAISGTTLEILGDPGRFNPILDQVLANALGDLEQYDISDPTTLRATYELIKQAHHLKGDLKSAIEWSDRAGATPDVTGATFRREAASGSSAKAKLDVTNGSITLKRS
jgi:hypothetical protein